MPDMVKTSLICLEGAMHACWDVCMHVCLCACTYVRNLYAGKYACMQVRVFASVYVCMLANIYMQPYRSSVAKGCQADGALQYYSPRFTHPHTCVCVCTLYELHDTRCHVQYFTQSLPCSEGILLHRTLRTQDTLPAMPEFDTQKLGVSFGMVKRIMQSTLTLVARTGDSED